MERMRKGFTLVETVLTMLLLGIILVVTGVLMGKGASSYRLVANRTGSVQEARMAMLRIVKELELLRQVTEASPQKVAFKDPNLSNVDFHLTGTTLYRGSDVLAENVAALQFTYYRDNGNTTTAPPQVRLIHIDLTVQGPPGSGSLSLRTEIFPKIFIYENYL